MAWTCPPQRVKRCDVPWRLRAWATRRPPWTMLMAARLHHGHNAGLHLTSTVSVRIDPGTTVGPYVVERLLAEGGMSVLYLARDESGELLVLKMVPPEIGTGVT